MTTFWNAAQYQSRHSYVFQFGEAVVDLLAPQPGERILDLGCGAGQLTAKIADAGAPVMGMDSSPDMIAQARANFPSIEFVLGDAANFSVAQPVDAVFSNAVLHWVKDAAGVARSVSRALKPGGRFIAEFGGNGNIRTVLAAMRAQLGDIELPWFYPSIPEYSAILEKEGLEVRYAALIDRPTEVKGEDGMEDWLAMYCNSIVSREQGRELAATLRPKLYREGVWTLDYRRLRVLAVKL